MTFILEYDKNHTKIQKSYLVKILKNPLKARLSSCQPAVRYDGYSCLNPESSAFPGIRPCGAGIDDPPVS